MHSTQYVQTPCPPIALRLQPIAASSKTACALRRKSINPAHSGAASATQLTCGEESFCLDGDCFEAMETTSNRFNESTSALAALAEAADGIGDPPMIFAGQGLKCTDAAFGFADCCKDGGWGTSIGIAQCNDEEKALGQAKEQGITIALGSYCARKSLRRVYPEKEDLLRL